MSKNALNVMAALVVLAASGFATWLLLPLAREPVAAAPLPNSVLVSIGPLEVNLALVLLLVAGGVPAAGIGMGLFVRWLSGKVPEGGSTPAPARKTPAATARREAAGEEPAAGSETSTAAKLGWLALLAVAIGAMVFLLAQVLPPGFTLF